MSALDQVVLESDDPAATEGFLKAAFDLDDRVVARPASGESSGFRGFTLSLICAQPSTVDSLAASALQAGATELKPVARSFWGYGGTVQAPDGTIWKLASSSKKDTGPPTRDFEEIALLIGCSDVKATKQFYVDQGLAVGKSFGSKYVELDTPGSRIKLALYGHRALAKDAGVPPEGTDLHRLVIGGDAGSFTDPDGFSWETASR